MSYRDLEAGPAPGRRRLAVAAVALLLAFVLLAAAIDLPALLVRAAAAASARYAERPMEVVLTTIAAFSAWIVVFIPTTPPELAMGFVFGLELGYAVDLSGKLVGSALCYVLGCSVLRSCAQRLVLSSEKYRDVFLAFEEEVVLRPWRTSAMLRVAWIPISAKNYGMAVLGVRPLHYFGTLVPLELVDTYVPVAIGSTAKDLAALLRGEYDAEKGRAALISSGLVFVEVALLVVLIARMGSVAKAAIERQRLKRAAAAEPAAAEPDPGL